MERVSKRIGFERGGEAPQPPGYNYLATSALKTNIPVLAATPATNAHAFPTYVLWSAASRCYNEPTCSRTRYIPELLASMET